MTSTTQNRLPLNFEYMKKVVKKANKIIKNHPLSNVEKLTILNNQHVIHLMREVARHYNYSDKVLPSIFSAQFVDEDNLIDHLPYYQAYAAVCYLDKPKRVRIPKTAA